MFLELAHTKLDIFNVAKAFVLDCYRQTKSFPPEEKFDPVHPQSEKFAVVSFQTPEQVVFDAITLQEAAAEYKLAKPVDVVGRHESHSGP